MTSLVAVFQFWV